MNKKTVMIHEINENVLSKDLSNFNIITFDDGLYSQYLNLEHYKNLQQPKIFFISTNIICPENAKQSTEPLYCGDAHKKAFTGNFENYMKWSQILEIYNTPNCFIGGHSHNHTKLSTLTENINDTKTMIEVFKSKNITITNYCFPYNSNYEFRKLSVLMPKYNTYGAERTPVEML